MSAIAVERPTPGGWASGASRRFLALAGGRAVAQVLAMAWFLTAARMLTDSEYGVVATGLTFMYVFAGLGDVGTTRTIVRHVAADHRTLWPAYGRAVALRVAGGLAIGLVTAAVVAITPVPVSPGVVLLAGLMATVSGITELAFAALRSIGHIKVEMGMLVFERALFLGLGAYAITQGAGPIAVLVLYLLTNALSAVVTTLAVVHHRTEEREAPGAFLDAEGRYTAASYALLAIAPRIGPLLVALFASATAVGIFSVAQRPIEAMAIFTLSTALPVLPIARELVTRGETARASRMAMTISGAMVVALVPIIVWIEVAPHQVLRILFGEGRYEGAAPVFRLLGLTALTWTFRSVGEFVLLGGERAKRLVAISGGGAVLAIALGIPLVLAQEAVGAAVAVLVAEVVMVACFVRTEPTLGDRFARHAHLPALGLGLVSAVLLVAVRTSDVATIAALVVLEGIALVLSVRSVRRLEEVH